VAKLNLRRIVCASWVLLTMSVTSNCALESVSDAGHVRSLFATRSGPEFSRVANRVRTGGDFVSRIAKRLGWTADAESYARNALAESIIRLERHAEASLRRNRGGVA